MKNFVKTDCNNYDCLICDGPIEMFTAPNELEQTDFSIPYEIIQEAEQIETIREEVNDNDDGERSDLCSSPDFSTTSSIISCSDGEFVESPTKEKRKKMRKRTQNRKSPNVTHWLWELLHDKRYKNVLSWTSTPEAGEFKVLDQARLAKMWGQRKAKNNQKMTYSNLARTLRYHYKTSKGQELVLVRRKMIYKFGKQFMESQRKR